MSRRDQVSVGISAKRCGTDCMYIDFFIVPPEERRHGIGTVAYKNWERSLPKEITTIYLFAADNEYGSTEAFWEKLGFEPRYTQHEIAAEIAAGNEEAWEWDREMVKSRVLPKKNPLDPYAFDTEPHPFIVQSRGKRRDEHIGVHTTSTMEQAATYAVQRAMAHGGTIAVIFEIDVAGLTPLPDVDATIQSVGEGDLLNELREAMEDADDVWEAVEHMSDMFIDSENEYPPQTWVDGATQWVDRQQRYAAVGALKDVEDLEERAEVNFADGLPPLFWSNVVDQRRFMEPIGLDRITKIYALRPVRNKLWGHGDMTIENDEGEEIDESEALQYDEYAPDVPGAPMIMSEVDFYEERFLPDTKVLYDSGRTPVEAQYHGTDLTRARKAFEELWVDLRNVWKYTQESE